jgi:hypothetical protein
VTTQAQTWIDRRYTAKGFLLYLYARFDDFLGLESGCGRWLRAAFGHGIPS